MARQQPPLRRLVPPGMTEQAVADLVALGNQLTKYGIDYGRDAESDYHLLDRLRELQECGDVADARGAMALFLERGQWVNVWGDDKWAEASYGVWQEEVEDLVVNAGLWLDADTGEPVDPGRPVETVYLPGDQPPVPWATQTAEHVAELVRPQAEKEGEQ